MKGAGQLGCGIDGAPRAVRQEIAGFDLPWLGWFNPVPELLDQNGAYSDRVHGLQRRIDHAWTDMELSVDDIHVKRPAI